MNEDGTCIECGDPMMGPAFRCAGCDFEACDACVHHGRHINAEGELVDMSGTYFDPDYEDEEENIDG